ncbi:uncharacterized protein LOC135150883 [Daucus carota subsp. sativus]|uniref:uncharacterized protein LOC135150883 n=1 Tax=Daucus carota subsp. sativus TaxID=79200 RepID=UPI0030834131
MSHIQDEQIPVGVFELSEGMSHNSGDFFMGLSDGVDPTQDLPSVGSGRRVVSEDSDEVPKIDVSNVKGKNVVGEVPRVGSSAVAHDGLTEDLVNVIENRTVVCEAVGSAKRKREIDIFPSPKRDRHSLGGEREVVAGKHSRPKKLVPSRNLGLLNRSQVRRKQQLVHSSSSGDEYEEDPNRGTKRKRVGYLFRTTPRPLLPDLLTEDDQWKLDGCSARKRVKRVERAAGLVLGELSGLTTAFMSEKARSARLQRRKHGLEEELNNVKAKLGEMEPAEKIKLQEQLAGVSKERDECRVLIRELEGQINASKEENRVAQEKLKALQDMHLDVTGKLQVSETARCEADKLVSRLRGDIEGLKVTLENVPRREVVLAEFRASDEYKQEVIESRVAAVETFRTSEDFAEEIRRAVQQSLSEFKKGVEYAQALDHARAMAIAEFRDGVAFKQAVGAEAGKMSLRIVECCREFFKDDMQRPSQEFGVFFTEFIRRSRGAPGRKPAM